MITSTHNPDVQLVRSLLGRSKERRATRSFVAEGVRLLEEALACAWPFHFALVSEQLNERGWELVNRMGAKGIRVEQVNAGLLNSLSATESSQGILAVLEYSELPLPPKLDFVLVLDQLRDPGNLGTLLRSAAAAGVQAVCLSPESAEPFAPKVVRSGMGAHFRLPIRTESWEAIGEHLTGLKICLADLQGVSCWQADLSIPLALIIGGEAAGVGPEARTLADTRVSIPMPGGSESLNAASAGAVLMFEALRQRQVRHPAGRMA